MKLIDLTLPMPGKEKGKNTAKLEELKISSAGTAYTGMIYNFNFGSMAGTYIDFPGHIKETDDGADASNYPIERLYRIDATVIHLDRKSGSGAISAEELSRVCLGGVSRSALIINALGAQRFDEIEGRSVYLAKDAVQWIISSGIYLLVSDVYESRALHGVFYDLFANGISTVCCPINLDKLTASAVKLSVFYLPFKGVTQVPCRVIAEIEE